MASEFFKKSSRILTVILTFDRFPVGKAADLLTEFKGILSTLVNEKKLTKSKCVLPDERLKYSPPITWFFFPTC